MREPHNKHRQQNQTAQLLPPRRLLVRRRPHWRGLALTTLISVGAALSLWQLWISSREPPASWRDSRSEPPRIALCFFGLTRSLRWTMPSVKARVLDVLLNDGFQVDVFVHTYHLREVNNERAGEERIKYATYEADHLALNATRSLVTDQDDFDLAWPNPHSMTHYKWNYPPALIPGVIKNVFRAYWSMEIVWGLMAQYASEEGFEYDVVMLLRPDVWFHVDVDLPTRGFPLPGGTVFLPSFDIKPGTERQNDRFAYGSVDAMRVVMHRIAALIAPNVDHDAGEVDSEWVFGHHLVLHNVTAVKIEFPFSRIRLNGVIPKGDFRNVRQACKSRKDPISCDMLRLGFRFPCVDDGGDTTA